MLTKASLEVLTHLPLLAQGVLLRRFANGFEQWKQKASCIIRALILGLAYSAIKLELHT